jgi:hypothetical protein
MRLNTTAEIFADSTPADDAAEWTIRVTGMNNEQLPALHRLG